MKMGCEAGLSSEVYSTVKSFALKGTLIPRTGLETLAESKGLEDLVNRLKGTVYSDAVSRVSKPYDAERIEMAFREYLATMHDALVYVTPKSSLLVAYYLKYIAWDLKVVLKGKALGMSYDEIVRHVNLYAEAMVGRRDLVVKALSAKDLDEAVALMKGSEFGDDADSAVKIYASKKDIQILDTCIDGAFYKSLVSSYLRLEKTRFHRSSSDARRVRSMVAVDVDSYNVVSLLRAKLWNLSPSQTRELMIDPIFDVPERTLEAVIGAESVGEGVKRLATTPYRRIIPVGIAEEDVIPELEAKFKMMGYDVAFRTFIWQVSGLGVVLGIVKLRELEVQNLSAIAFGVEQGIGLQNIMSKLVTLF